MSKHINNEFLKLYYIVWLRLSLFLNKYFQIFKLFIVTQHFWVLSPPINHYPEDKFEWNQYCIIHRIEIYLLDDIICLLNK